MVKSLFPLHFLSVTCFYLALFFLYLVIKDDSDIGSFFWLMNELIFAVLFIFYMHVGVEVENKNGS